MGFAVKMIYPGVLALASLFGVGKRAQNQSLKLSLLDYSCSSFNDVFPLLQLLEITCLVPSYAFFFGNFMSRRHVDKLPEIGNAEDGVGALESRCD